MLEKRLTWDKIMYAYYSFYSKPVYSIEKDYWGSWSEVPFE